MVSGGITHPTIEEKGCIRQNAKNVAKPAFIENMKNVHCASLALKKEKEV